jgi:hypothetical protein
VHYEIDIVLSLTLCTVSTTSTVRVRGAHKKASNLYTPQPNVNVRKKVTTGSCGRIWWQCGLQTSPMDQIKCVITCVDVL